MCEVLCGCHATRFHVARRAGERIQGGEAIVRSAAETMWRLKRVNLRLGCIRIFLEISVSGPPTQRVLYVSVSLLAHFYRWRAPGSRTFALDSDAWRTRPTRSSAATCARNSSLSSPSQRVICLRLRGSASDEGKAKVTALRFKLAVTQALNTLFGEVGAALPVDLLGFDEPKQEAILRLPSKCALPACMSMFITHALHPATMAPGVEHGSGAR